jgi:hypothetical protein
MRTLDLSDQVPTLRSQLILISSLESPSPNSVTMGLRTSTYKFWEDKNNQAIRAMKAGKYRSSTPNLKIQNSKCFKIQDFEHRHDATSRKFHTHDTASK